MLSDFQRQILCSALEKGFVTSQELLSTLWGKAQYGSAHASLSRSLTRLWKRGLTEYWKNITSHGTGITLTPAGKALAHTIKAEAEKSRISVKKA